MLPRSLVSCARSTKRRSDVVALYVDHRGPYPRLVRDWYDPVRDARTYAGPLPVVAHPPCGPWGQLRTLCKRPEDRPLALHALNVVRAFGGILEHPRGSKLWAEAGLPFPGMLPDRYGGFTLEVEQVAWGHACRKPTWLYIVGVDVRDAEAVLDRTGGEPTHQIRGSRANGRDLKAASAEIRRRTPRAFAECLLNVAATARRR
jgi:hypothetical protein